MAAALLLLTVAGTALAGEVNSDIKGWFKGDPEDLKGILKDLDDFENCKEKLGAAYTVIDKQGTAIKDLTVVVKTKDAVIEVQDELKAVTKELTDRKIELAKLNGGKGFMGKIRTGIQAIAIWFVFKSVTKGAL